MVSIDINRIDQSDAKPPADSSLFLFLMATALISSDQHVESVDSTF